MNSLKKKLIAITDEELDNLTTRELLTYKVLCRFAIRNDDLKEKLNQINNIVNYEMLDKEHLLVAINEIRKILGGDSND